MESLPDDGANWSASAADLYEPPPSVPKLPLMVQSVSVVVPPKLHRPPPIGAVLPTTVQLVSDRVPPVLHRPPPNVEPTV